LPDDWERFWLINLEGQAADDPDEDGLSHRDEWMAGTDPRNASSLLRILQHGLGAGPAWIRFPMAPSRSYRVEWSTDLKTWREEDGVLTFPERGIAEWRSLGGQGSAGGFFRVRVE
jgi:hypothetical protein